jgi:hypothetical protein
MKKIIRFIVISLCMMESAGDMGAANILNLEGQPGFTISAHGASGNY